MEGPVRPPREPRTRFVDASEQLHAEQLSLDADGPLLQALSPGFEVSEANVAKLNGILKIAALPIPRGRVVPTSRVPEIKQKRQEFFDELGLEGPDNILRPAIHRAKQNYGGHYPPPLTLIWNGRLLQFIGAPVGPSIASNSDFVTTNIDLECLDVMERVMRSHRLSYKETPALVLRNPDTVQQDFRQLQEYLNTLRLPFGIREIVHSRPMISPKLYDWLVLLAAQHGNLRNYIRSTHPQKQAGGLRAQLLSDILKSLSRPIEPYLLSVIENGELHIPAVNSLNRQLRPVRLGREAMLQTLVTDQDATSKLGRQVIDLYFKRRPLTDDEVQRHPVLEPYITPPKPKKLTAAERLRDERLSRDDQPWLEELMNRKIDPEEWPQLLALLNSNMLRGSIAMQDVGNTPALSNTIEHRYTFFELLGWMTRGHPLHHAFNKFLAHQNDEGGFMILPIRIVRIARELANPAKGGLVGVFKVGHFRVLHYSLPTVRRRLVEAKYRAAKDRVGVDRLIVANPFNFVSGSLTAYLWDELLNTLDKDYTREDLLSIVPEAAQLEPDKLWQLARLALSPEYDEVRLDARWVARRIKEMD